MDCTVWSVGLIRCVWQRRKVILLNQDRPTDCRHFNFLFYFPLLVKRKSCWWRENRSAFITAANIASKKKKKERIEIYEAYRREFVDLCTFYTSIEWRNIERNRSDSVCVHNFFSADDTYRKQHYESWLFWNVYRIIIVQSVFMAFDKYARLI